MNRIVVLIAIACGVLSALLCWKMLGLIPHVPDELSYLYQARILASGNLSVEAPAVPEAFTVRWDHVLRDSKGWRSMYPPGWPLLLAAGWLIGAPWLINPILLCVSVLGIFQLAKQLFDERTALFAVIAFACSPFVLIMSSGFMAHPSTLCFAVWCAFFLARGRGNDWIFAGAAGTFALMIRPYTAVPLLLPILVYSLWKTANRTKALMNVAGGALPLLVLFLIYNHFLFGSLFSAGYSHDPDATFRGSLFEHFRLNVPWYLSSLNRALWGLPLPDLLIFVPLLLPHKNWNVDLLLTVCFMSLLFAYSIFYYRDIVYAGPRYLYESVGFLAILAARSFRVVETILQRWVRFKPGILLLIIFIYPLVSTLPAQIVYHSRGYHGQSAELLNSVESKGIGRNALILISGNPYVFRTFFQENSLNPANSERVFAQDIPGMRDSIVRAYARAEIWSMRIDLIPVKGVNSYEDRAEIRSVEFQRIQ